MRRMLFVMAALAAVGVARAIYVSDFESPLYTGSAAGTSATGQDGWYNPIAGSLDANIYTYSGNALGLSSNPHGNAQFIGGQAPGGTTYVRAQHDVGFLAGVNTVSFDFNAKFNGQLPATENLGSLSLQPSASANYWLTLFQWGNNAALADKFNANYGAFASGGGGMLTLNAGAAWTDLAVDHWYRSTTTWDFASNRIISVSIQDLTAGGAVTTFSPTDWYLAGGANNAGGLPMPTALRFFLGGSTVGNTMGFDNLTLNGVPGPGAIVAFGLGLLVAARRRRR